MKIIDRVLHAIITRALAHPPTRILIAAELQESMLEVAEEAIDEAIEDHERSHRPDAEDVRDLDSYIESSLEDYFRSNSRVDADSVDNLEEAIEAEVNRMLGDRTSDLYEALASVAKKEPAPAIEADAPQVGAQ